jgi:hypothetical protein
MILAQDRQWSIYGYLQLTVYDSNILPVPSTLDSLPLEPSNSMKRR